MTTSSIPIDLILTPSLLTQFTQVLAATGFICVLAPIEIQHHGSTIIPVSLQSFVILLIPSFLGSVRGCLSVLLYLISGGFMNLPVFAKGASGFDVLFGATSGGFLWSFLVGAYWSGSFVESSKHPIDFKDWFYCFLVGHGIILTLGFFTLWIAKPTAISSFSSFLNDLIIPLLPGLFCKSLIGGMIASIGNKQLLFLALSNNYYNGSTKAL